MSNQKQEMNPKEGYEKPPYPDQEHNVPGAESEVR